MTDKLVRALKSYRSANDVDQVAHAEEMIEEALNDLAEKCRRETIVVCAEIARKRRAGDAADDMISLMDG